MSAIVLPAREGVCVCIGVCERERERANERGCVCERVCVCARERERSERTLPGAADISAIVLPVVSERERGGEELFLCERE